MLVLDTSVVSTIMHRVPSSLDRLREYRPAEVVLTAPVTAEIRFGLGRLAGRSKRRRLLEEEYLRLRSVVSWADWDERAAEEFGRQKARLVSQGRIIDDFDIAIGAIAIGLEGTVATHNPGHFERLSGLKVEDWGEPSV